MELKLAQVGSVFHLDSERGGYNQFKKEDYGHYYIVIKSPGRTGLARCQLMTITSMRNKEVAYELPVVMNGEVSYIAPYNIYTYSEVDLTLKGYKGSITDEPYINKNDFIMLLMELYVLYNSPYPLSDEYQKQIIMKYEDYCNNFWKSHSDKEEHRDPIGEDAKSEYLPKFNNIRPDEPEKVKTEKVVKEPKVKSTPVQTIVTSESVDDLIKKFKSLEKRLPAKLSDWTTKNKTDFIKIVENDCDVKSDKLAENSNRWSSGIALRAMYRKVVASMNKPPKKESKPVVQAETPKPVENIKKEESKVVENVEVDNGETDNNYTTDPHKWSKSKLLTAKRYIMKYRFNMQMMRKKMPFSNDNNISDQIKLVLDTCKKLGI